MGHNKLVETDPSKNYPDFLKGLGSYNNKDIKNHPIIVRMDSEGSETKLKSLIKANKISEVIDNYGEQFAELVLSKNAHLYRANPNVQIASIAKILDEHYGKSESWKTGTWVYFPWSGKLIHILEQVDFEDLRTIRNKDLITSDEQKKLFDYSIASFGMSVGSAGALAVGISGISRKIKLIDGAVISGSNLNRIMTGVSNVGVGKATVIGRQIYEMNPYSEISYFDKVDHSNIKEILENPWKANLAIDEIDDLEMKIKIRLESRRLKIPVLMATELGDTVMLDVERYDLEPNRELFHGLVPGIDRLASEPPENHREWMKYAVKIIDPKNMPIRMQGSLLKIGSTIVTHPQLGSTVMITGGVLAFAVKNIALGHKLESGRYVVSLENNMLKDHGTRSHKKAHKKHTKIINRAMESM